MIVSTYPNKKSISKVANKLVQGKLVACVNMTKISSVYSWKGKVENVDEFLAIFKTTQSNKTKVKNEIKITHPYTVPEIAEIQINSINKLYLDWLIDST